MLSQELISEAVSMIARDAIRDTMVDISALAETLMQKYELAESARADLMKELLHLSARTGHPVQMHAQPAVPRMAE